MGPVAGVMAKLYPVVKKLLCLGQKVDRSVEQLKKKIDGVIGCESSPISRNVR